MRRRVQCLAAAFAALTTAIFLTSAGGQTGPQIDKAEHKSYTEAIPGSDVAFDMVAIPGGVFLMGSPDDEAGRGADEGPLHRVRIRPFWMAKCEVTWEEFNAYRKEKGAENPEQNDERLAADADAITGPTPPYVDETYGHPRDVHPAICMTWHGAMEYCRWLSQKTGKVYRLPTEAEWEYAARAGTTTPYFFGNDPKALDQYAWTLSNSKIGDRLSTHKVGSLKPNPWGLHDMYGNVFEWCADQYDKDFYKGFAGDKIADNVFKAPTERRFSHVARGGCFSDEAAKCRSAARRGSEKAWIKHDPQRPQSIWWLTKMDVVGFRVVRAVEETPELKGFRSKITRESRN
jgi:formylglycine-generating enzyme required for sulfatase activity